MDSQFYTRESAIVKATEIKTALALSKLRLLKGPFVPTQFTAKATLIANEATFDGYTAGGYALAAWSGPDADVNGGAIITSPLVHPTYGPAEEPPITNDIVGWWIEDATGDVRMVGILNPARLLQVVGDGFPMLVQVTEARNPPVSIPDE